MPLAVLNRVKVGLILTSTGYFISRVLILGVCYSYCQLAREHRINLGPVIMYGDQSSLDMLKSNSEHLTEDSVDDEYCNQYSKIMKNQ